MEFESAQDFAVKKASEEFGSDVLEKINNKYPSSATGNLKEKSNCTISETLFRVFKK